MPFGVFALQNELIAKPTLPQLFSEESAVLMILQVACQLGELYRSVLAVFKPEFGELLFKLL